MSFSTFFEALARVLHEDLVHLLAQAQDLPRLDVDVGRLALDAAERLVDHDPRVGQREALALGPGRQQPAPPWWPPARCRCVATSGLTYCMVS